MRAKYDVIVIGGGTAGVIAAIQAGRAGAATLLVEKTGMLGGTITTGGISAPAAFFAWGEQIIGGIGWELVRKTLEETGQPVPTPESTRGNAKARHISIDKTIFAALCDQAVLDAGVDLLFHAMPAAIAFRDDRWTVGICTKSGLREIQGAAPRRASTCGFRTRPIAPTGGTPNWSSARSRCPGPIPKSGRAPRRSRPAPAG